MRAEAGRSAGRPGRVEAEKAVDKPDLVNEEEPDGDAQGARHVAQQSVERAEATGRRGQREHGRRRRQRLTRGQPQPEREVASTRPSEPPIVSGLPVTTPSTEWPLFIE